MFSKTIGGCVFALGCALNSYAADVPAARRTAVTAVPAYSWNGFYVGANAGYSWGRASTDFTLAGAALTSTSVSPNGFIGGGQLGYNWQTGNILLGLEADFQGSGQEGDSSFGFTVGGVTFTSRSTTSIDWFGTVRGRIGYASDRWLSYVTGGWAYGRATTEGTTTGGGVTTPFSGSETRHGWTAGVGVEAALWNAWSWKAEYLYLDFGKISDSDATPFGTFASSTKVSDHMGRLGVNYRF